jgi:hypothetical protein
MTCGHLTRGTGLTRFPCFRGRNFFGNFGTCGEKLCYDSGRYRMTHNSRLFSCLVAACVAVPALAGRVGSTSGPPVGSPAPVGVAGSLSSASPVQSGALTQSQQNTEVPGLSALLSALSPSAIINVGPVVLQSVAPRSPGLTSPIPRASDPSDRGNTAAVVPLPTSAWMGLSLLASIGLAHVVRKRTGTR